MRFVSTRGGSPPVSLKEAVLGGLAPDGGLYLPAEILRMPPSLWERMSGLSLPEIGFEVAAHFVDGDLPLDRLRAVVERALDFDCPVVSLRMPGIPTREVHCLELFHGPSLAFKDFGARFMAELLSEWAAAQDRPLTILTATSGDTGSAVAMGFRGVPGVRVVTLYPQGQVSRIQERLLTSQAGNVQALRVSGAFDDCQRLVKQAFQDEELRQALRLTSANSINLARLIPQTFYYCYAWSRLSGPGQVVFAVPSGNLGNLTAGLLAARMGLPVERFVAATNRNSSLPEYLSNGTFQPRPSIPTLSNSMDVGNPSNFERIQALYQGDLAALRRDLAGYCFDDSQTQRCMREVFQDNSYPLDPHGAVGLLGLEAYLREERTSSPGVFLATAHPAKFPEVFAEATGRKVPVPERLSRLLRGPTVSIPLRPRLDDLRSFLLDCDGGRWS